VYISDTNHIVENIEQPIAQQGLILDNSVVVEENCWLGINSVISGNLTIGRGSVVGANTIVTKDIPPFSVFVGNPGRIVKMYNPQTKLWEKTDTEKDMNRIIEIRKKGGLPSRDELKRILSSNARFGYIEEMFAGRGINL
jgi:acyl-[acyl carrier protein]--UDP-N-acetylglucosamine O-acyltransferase